MSTTDFVNGLFERLFFAGDKAGGISAFENEIASDAVFECGEHIVALKWTNSKHHRFNGKSQTKEQVFEAIKNLHAKSTVKLNSLQDLAVTPGVVAQVSKSTVTTGGSAKEQTTVRIVKVEERGARRL
ncbi:hypothetical protein B0H17DRAFT_1173530 [Mycena rosella]|uniref:Uncharacterized protein n=1 Tax=Mycena rosella TaxID=1033263 RepID=A0AAD7MCG5_MYCRO|nr:hypothetical protein B0H17DRAFT_1173530 [Mycena rosella]